MTTTYDPRDRLYTDEYDVRLEAARVFDVCTSCQKCVSLCPTFPALISAVESKPDSDAGRLTPDEQDAIINECFRCMKCSSTCPYMPGVHEESVDFPRLVDRYRAMQKAQKKWSLRSSVGHHVLGRSTSMARLIARRNSDGVFRRVLARTTGISRVQMTRDVLQVRLKSWVAMRQQPSKRSDSRVAIFPTCVVEALRPHIAQQLVDDYVRREVECSLVGEKLCCGAPALLHGETKYFTKNAKRVINALTGVIRAGSDIVVADPRCRDVIVRDYPHYLGTDESRFLASRVSVAPEVTTADLADSYAWWGLHLDHPRHTVGSSPDFIKKPLTD